MTTPTKAVLFDLRAYIADNNLRRSVAAFSVNYGSVAEAASLSTFIVPLAGPAVVVTSPMNPVTATLIRTTRPLTASVTFRNATVLSVGIKSLFFMDADIVSISISNHVANTEAAKVTVLQG